MDEIKLNTLTRAAQFDICGYDIIHRSEFSPARFIHQAKLPGGGCMSLFKVLYTNTCINDCGYCVNQIAFDRPRRSFTPDELAKTFMELYHKRMVRGLFLTSGIGHNPAQTQEAMVNTVEILRQHYQFKGYIHLKILPGAPFDCIAEGCKLASRVSINMEAPTPAHLARLSSKKNLAQGIVERMRWVKQITAVGEGIVPAGQTTQFVVGASSETDRDILHTVTALYSEIELRRAYFSAYQPVGGPRLEGVLPAPPMREHRLYQADWLIRVYDFPHQEVELAFTNGGYLPLNTDPKQIIAQKQPWLFPVDVNKSSYEELLRVPGIGPVSARRIIDTRRDHSITSVEQLRKMRVATRRAVPYIWFRSMLPLEKQTSFIPQVEPEEEPAPTLAQALA